MIGFLCHWCFFLQWKHGLVPVESVVFPLFLLPPLTHSPLPWFIQSWTWYPCLVLTLSLTGSPHNVGPRDSAHGRTSRMLHVNGIAEEADMLLHTSSLTIWVLHCPFALHSQNTASKITLFTFSGWQQTSNKSSAGPCANFTGHVPMKQTLTNWTSFQVATGLETADRESLTASRLEQWRIALFQVRRTGHIQCDSKSHQTWLWHSIKFNRHWLCSALTKNPPGREWAGECSSNE